ncbi:MAG: hypothetical protein ACTS44_01445 [Candidatus Hodgkinia cicadicola]
MHFFCYSGRFGELQWYGLITIPQELERRLTCGIENNCLRPRDKRNGRDFAVEADRCDVRRLTSLVGLPCQRSCENRLECCSRKFG